MPRPATLILLFILVRGAAADAQQPDPVRSCCRELHLLYEPTIFKINAMRLRLRVDEGTGQAVAALVHGAPRTEVLEQAVARRYTAAEAATIDMEFLVSVSGETFLSNTLKAYRRLVGDGVVDPAGADTVARETRDRFAFLMAEQVRPADRLRYEILADTVTTTYRRGETLLASERHVGRRFRHVVLATYFAPSSDFREGLLDDLFRLR